MQKERPGAQVSPLFCLLYVFYSSSLAVRLFQMSVDQSSPYFNSIQLFHLRGTIRNLNFRFINR